MKKANSSDPVQKLLWHGTSCDPSIIIKKDGFSYQFANDQGFWGRAIQFAKLADYSHGYAQKSSEKKSALFYASVLTGQHIELVSDKSFRVPPDGYDSIKGSTAGHDVYMVNQNDKTYPMFHVYYQF